MTQVARPRSRLWVPNQQDPLPTSLKKLPQHLWWYRLAPTQRSHRYQQLLVVAISLPSPTSDKMNSTLGRVASLPFNRKPNPTHSNTHARNTTKYVRSCKRSQMYTMLMNQITWRSLRFLFAESPRFWLRWRLILVFCNGGYSSRHVHSPRSLEDGPNRLHVQLWGMHGLHVQPILHQQTHRYTGLSDWEIAQHITKAELTTLTTSSHRMEGGFFSPCEPAVRCGG